MARFARVEIEDALDRMDRLRAESSRAGDWTIWAGCLSEDVEFHDTIYGSFHGRPAVVDFVVRVHAPFPHLRYERDGLWNLEQDVTLSSAQADANFQGWLAAGGRFAAPPLAPPNAAR